MFEQEFDIDGFRYDVQVKKRTSMQLDAPRLVVVSFMPNAEAAVVLRACVKAVRRYTPEPHELWVVDNNSPAENARTLLDLPGVNVVLNHTEPAPPKAASGDGGPNVHGSYANAVALELAARIVDRDTRLFMPMHMDTMPCKAGWLTFLSGKITGNVAAAGVRMDTTRTPEGVLHVLGYMVDFQLFRRLGLDFMPKLPQHDVGDTVSVRLREAGYGLYACRNTLWEPDLAGTIDVSSPLRNIGVDRSFDDKGEVIFLHLGRGVEKSSGRHNRGAGIPEWLALSKALMPDAGPAGVAATAWGMAACPPGLDYSVRRHFVDEFHSRAVACIAPGSRVLDLGGNKVDKRGKFDIGVYGFNVVYSNLSDKKMPDVLADAARIPFKDGCFDAVICSELLEHVPDPPSVLRETHRVLKSGGTLLVCAPFMHRIHGDPFDYGRYTDYYWREKLEGAGFSGVEIEKHGLFFCVAAEMLREFALQNHKEGRPRLGPIRGLVRRFVSWARARAIEWDAKPGMDAHPVFGGFTTGFGIKATKR